MNQPRSYLFVPGNRPDRFAKAAGSGAHRIILDLEDSVRPDEKEKAREHVARWFREGGTGVVRINGADTDWASADLTFLTAFDHAEVMIPKSSRAFLGHVAQVLSGRPLIALVETVEGLLALNELAVVPGVARLAFGNLDFSTDARIPGAGAVLDPARFQFVLASRHGGLRPPIDGVTPELGEDAVLEADVARARNLGFTAKLCIHPRQVAAVNEVFAPTKDEVAWARRVIRALAGSGGAAVQLDGQMVDRPLEERARYILEEADENAPSDPSK